MKKIIKNLFKRHDQLNISDVISCSCSNGMIDCPGCKDVDDRDKVKYICAGCHGKGKVVCGKCGGEKIRYRYNS